MCVFNSVAAGTSCHLQQKKMPKNSTDFFIHNKNFKQHAINLDTYLVEFIFVILIMCMCTFLCVGMHTCVLGSRRPEVLDSLELGWQGVVWPICHLCWEQNPGPLLEQSSPVTSWISNALMTAFKRGLHTAVQHLYPARRPLCSSNMRLSFDDKT